MEIRKKIEVFGDSILKGIQINPLNNRYCVDNHIDIAAISQKHCVAIKNHSHFGSTIVKGQSLLQKHLDKGLLCDMVVMDYGGNDCDFEWAAISERPDEEHLPHTPLQSFVETYRKMIRTLKERGIRPVLTTLPPLEPQKFFNWFCGALNRENILKWLGGVSSIYRFQEHYSRTVEQIAVEEQVALVDLRGAFLQHRRIDQFLCEDGTHPNTEGQRLITAAFMDFAERVAAEG